MSWCYHQRCTVQLSRKSTQKPRTRTGNNNNTLQKGIYYSADAASETRLAGKGCRSTDRSNPTNDVKATKQSCFAHAVRGVQLPQPCDRDEHKNADTVGPQKRRHWKVDVHQRKSSAGGAFTKVKYIGQVRRCRQEVRDRQEKKQFMTRFPQLRRKRQQRDYYRK